VEVARVDVTSEPKLATDEKLDEVRTALEGLRNLGVARGDEDVIVVSFEVDAMSLGEAVTIGERELSQRIEAAGSTSHTSQPVRPAGATSSTPSCR
jgi:hypothetical protein